MFHGMEGSIRDDTKQERVAEISGHLIHTAKFGRGLLGHLDQGGTFEVRQAEVAPGYWELTALNVHMKGKALFFKTISVQQYYSRSELKLVPQNLTVAQVSIFSATLHRQTDRKIPGVDGMAAVLVPPAPCSTSINTEQYTLLCIVLPSPRQISEWGRQPA